MPEELAETACRAYSQLVDRELADLWQQMLEIERADSEPASPAEVREAYEGIERMFGERVKEWRQARNWKQEDLAEKLRELGFEMHQTTVAKLEKGSRPLRVAEASAIATIFGVPPLAVFLGPPPERTPMPLERMHEKLQSAQEHLEQIRQAIYEIAKTYADQVLAVTEMAQVMNEAALDAQRRSPDRPKPKGQDDDAETQST